MLQLHWAEHLPGVRVSRFGAAFFSCDLLTVVYIRKKWPFSCWRLIRCLYTDSSWVQVAASWVIQVVRMWVVSEGGMLKCSDPGSFFFQQNMVPVIV